MEDFTFNLNTEEEDTEDNFAPLAPGKYPFVVEEIEVKKSQAGHVGLNVTYTVCGEKYTGRKVFEWYNWEHPKLQVQKIARGQIAKLVKAAFKGDQVISNPQDIVGKSFIGRVSIKKGGGMNGEDVNSLNGFAEYDGLVHTKEDVSHTPDVGSVDEAKPFEDAEGDINF